MIQAGEQGIEFVLVKSVRKRGAALERPKQPFNFFKLWIHGPVRNPVHDQPAEFFHEPNVDQSSATRECDMLLAREESGGDCAAITRGSQMNLGDPDAAGFVDGLETAFVEEPAPSGCGWMTGSWSGTASILICIMFRACKVSKT